MAEEVALIEQAARRLRDDDLHAHLDAGRAVSGMAGGVGNLRTQSNQPAEPKQRIYVNKEVGRGGHAWQVAFHKSGRRLDGHEKGGRQASGMKGGAR